MSTFSSACACVCIIQNDKVSRSCKPMSVQKSIRRGVCLSVCVCVGGGGFLVSEKTQGSAGLLMVIDGGGPHTPLPSS